MKAGPLTPEGGDDSPPVTGEVAPGSESTQASVPAQRTEAEAVALHTQISAELRHQRPIIRAKIAASGLHKHMDELEQATLIRIYQARMNSVSAYTADENGEAFARRMTGWVIIDFRRAQGRDRLVPVAELEETTGIPAADEALAIRVQLLGFLEKHLPDETERAIYILHHVEDYKIVEIAKLLGMDRGTVSTWLRRAEGRIGDAPKDELM